MCLRGNAHQEDNYVRLPESAFPRKAHSALLADLTVLTDQFESTVTEVKFFRKTFGSMNHVSKYPSTIGEKDVGLARLMGPGARDLTLRHVI